MQTHSLVVETLRGLPPSAAAVAVTHPKMAVWVPAPIVEAVLPGQLRHFHKEHEGDEMWDTESDVSDDTAEVVSLLTYDLDHVE